MPKGYDAHPSNLSRVVTIARMDPGLLAHAREVADLAGAVASALGLERRGRHNVARAAELHDIGKLAIPAEILAKRGPLDPGAAALLGHAVRPARGRGVLPDAGSAASRGLTRALR